MIQGIKERVGGGGSMAQEMLTYRFQWKLKIQIRANTAATLQVSVPSGENIASKISNFVGKSVLPRVAYVNKFQKKIVRFAIDLPGGGKLGVRLEKKQGTLSLSLIAPQRMRFGPS